MFYRFQCTSLDFFNFFLSIDATLYDYFLIFIFVFITGLSNKIDFCMLILCIVAFLKFYFFGHLVFFAYEIMHL